MCFCCDDTENQDICGYGQYQCSSEQCISIDKVCDGTSDCLHDADEQHCGMLTAFSVRIIDS